MAAKSHGSITPTWQSDCGTATLYLGDCLEVLPHLEGVDAVVADPPYPEIDRDYGRFSESEWHEMMDAVVCECRRMLMPSGSAVFILQPNSEKIGRMRPWLWEFMAKWTRQWNMVQDAWWWNTIALPEAHAIQGRLMRPSLKAVVWLGAPDCYRNQDAVLWTESESCQMRRLAERASGRTNKRITHPSGQGMNTLTRYDAAERRGGVTPYNVYPARPTDETTSKNAGRHSATTPLKLCDWWVRYICPKGGTIVDPFIGSGTVGLAAIQRGCRVVGIERMPRYFEIAKRRINEALHSQPLFAGQ